AVAVEGQAELALSGLQFLYQLQKILGLRRIRMVVRKAPVHFAVQLLHLAAQPPVKPRREHAGDAVAAIDRDAKRTRQPYVARDALDVRIEDVGGAALAASLAWLSRLDPAAQLLHVFAPQRAACDHHLEAVVIGRVMAAGDGDAA